MKRIISLLLSLVMLCAAVPALADFDLSYVEQSPNIFDVSVNSSGTTAYIDTDSIFTVANRSFTHRYESDYKYSFTYYDIAIVNYNKSTARPVLRLWIEYVGKKAIHADSFSLIFNGKKYTFTNASKTESYAANDQGEYEETLVALFSLDNLEFLADTETYLNSLKEGRDDFVDAIEQNADVTLILHGTEDISVKLPGSYLLDFWLMKVAFIEFDGLDALSKVTNGTPLTITTAR